jgi:hypothetical protein
MLRDVFGIVMGNFSMTKQYFESNLQFHTKIETRREIGRTGASSPRPSPPGTVDDAIDQNDNP